MSERWTPARLAGLAVVLGVGVLCAFSGLTVRDLGDTEFEEFSGSGPLGILVRSISPTPNDWGAHMPLSHLFRWWIVELLGDQSPLGWRLHAAVAAVAASVLAWWAVARTGRLTLAVAAGVLVAVNPVLGFHSHESSNYSLSTLLGGVLLLALLRWERGLPRAGILLGIIVFLGMFNDLFFLFPALFVFLWTAGRAAGLGGGAITEVRRRFLATWGLVTALAAGPVIWFVSHLLRLNADQIIGPHADPIPSEGVSLWNEAWQLGLRFAGGYMGGYGDVRDQDPWVTWAPLLLLVLVVLWAWRDRAPEGEVHRLAVWMVLGSLALILVIRLGFGLLFAREFTTEPRIFTSAIIPLALAWTGLCSGIGKRGGLVALAALIAVVALPTARQLANLPDRDSRAVALIGRHHRPGDMLIVYRQIRWRLPPTLAAADAGDCLQGGSEDALPDRIWIAAPSDGNQRPVVPMCGGESLDLLATGRWRLRVHERWFPPDADRKSGSFIPELIVALLERAPPSAAPGDLRSVHVSFLRGLLAGGDEASVARARLLVDQDGTVDDRSEARMFEQPWQEQVRFDGMTVGDWMRLEVNRSVDLSSSWFGLLRPLGQPILDLDPVLVLSDPLEPARTVRIPALTSPTLRVAERALRALLALGLALGLLVARVRPPRSW